MGTQRAQSCAEIAEDCCFNFEFNRGAADNPSTENTKTGLAANSVSSVSSALLSKLCVPMGPFERSVVPQKGLQMRLDATRECVQIITALEG